MDKEILSRIENAMDKAMKDFLDDENSIFNNIKEQMLLKYGVVKHFKNWKKNKICIVRGCNNKSIERSHTIQKSSSIKEISEDGHVLTPRFNYNSGKIEMITLGINEASTFPGYCNGHENLFEEYEILKDFKSEKHISLQLYRTICREIVINEHNLERNEFLLNSYTKFRDDRIKESIIHEIGVSTLKKNDISVNNIKFESKDYRIRQLIKQKNELTRYLNEYLNKMNDAVLNDINKEKFQKLEYLTFDIGFKIPVALAGRGNFYSKRKPTSKSKLIEFIFNVLPLKDKTYLVLSTLKKHTLELRAYISQYKYPIQLLTLIEQWMIYGSDHWFITPSVWYKLELDQQNIILKTLIDDSYNIGHESKMSIFNEIRTESVKYLEEHDDEISDDLRSILEKEREKITFANKKYT